ncbi:MAG: hypothetical protein RBU29_06425 [bacterium]|jgi:anti-sigma factor RsiW|nr:hypothetical protein [bacterium]
MNQNSKPTLEHLSLYFDGLLPEAESRQVEAFVQTEESCKMLEVMALFDSALQPDLDEEAIDSMLANTVHEVHARIQQQEPRREAQWFFFLTPQFILSSVFALVLLMVGVSMAPWEHWGQGTQIASLPKEDASFEIPSLDKIQEIAQGQALIAMAQMAKKAVDGGVGYVAQQTEASKASFEGTEQTLVANAIRTVRAPEASPAPAAVVDSDSAATENPMLVTMGKTQLALGLGATVLQLVTVF